MRSFTIIKYGWVLFGLILSTVAQGGTLASLEMYSKYDYRDLESLCTNTAMAIPIYLVADVNSNGKARAIVLAKQPQWPLGERFYLTANEVAGISFHQDQAGRFWVKEMQLTARMAHWIMLNTDFGLFPCLKNQFASLAPVTKLEFDLEGINEGISVTISQTVEFGGKLANGSVYETEFLLNQRQGKGDRK